MKISENEKLKCDANLHEVELVYGVCLEEVMRGERVWSTDYWGVLIQIFLVQIYFYIFQRFTKLFFIQYSLIRIAAIPFGIDSLIQVELTNTWQIVRQTSIKRMRNQKFLLSCDII